MYAGPDLKSSPYSSLLGNVLKYICNNSMIVRVGIVFIRFFNTQGFKTLYKFLKFDIILTFGLHSLEFG